MVREREENEGEIESDEIHETELNGAGSTT